MLNTPQDYEGEPPALLANGTIAGKEEDQLDQQLKIKEGLVHPHVIPGGDGVPTTTSATNGTTTTPHVPRKPETSGTVELTLSRPM